MSFLVDLMQLSRTLGRCWRGSWRRSALQGPGRGKESLHPARDRISTWRAVVAVSDGHVPGKQRLYPYLYMTPDTAMEHLLKLFNENYSKLEVKENKCVCVQPVFYIF